MQPLRTPPGPQSGVSASEQGLPIPDGRYRLTAVSPQLLLDPSYRLERQDTAGTRFDFGGRALESFRPELASQHSRQAILLSPEPRADPVLGFRGLDAEQLQSLRAKGCEAAWVVKVGEHFDVLLRPHKALSEEEARALRDHLVAQHGLPDQRGVFQNAVRLPGHSYPEGGKVATPVLLEVRAEPFSASREILHELRQARLREPVDHTARELPRIEELRTVPLVVASCPAQPRPTLPSPEHEALQSRVEALARGYRLPETQELKEVTDAALIDRALAANRELLAQEPFSSRLPVELSTLESEIAHRRRELIQPLQAVERELTLDLRQVEASWLALYKQGTPERLAAHGSDLDRALAVVTKVDELSARWLRLTAAQQELDLDRLRAAIAAQPASSETLKIGVLRLQALRGAADRCELAPADRLRLAADAVLRGEQTAEDLRRLNQALYAVDRVVPVPQRLSGLGRDPAVWAQEQNGALTRIRELAGLVARSDASAESLKALSEASRVAIGLQRRLELTDRQARGLPEPHPVPKGQSEIVWRAAWLHRARYLGLKPNAAEAHLANAFPSPLIAGHLAMRIPVVRLALEATRTARAGLARAVERGMRL